MNAHVWHTETLHIKYIYIEILIRLCFFIERDVKEILCVWDRERGKREGNKISIYIKKNAIIDRDIDRYIANIERAALIWIKF